MYQIKFQFHSFETFFFFHISDVSIRFFFVLFCFFAGWFRFLFPFFYTPGSEYSASAAAAAAGCFCPFFFYFLLGTILMFTASFPLLKLSTFFCPRHCTGFLAFSAEFFPLTLVKIIQILVPGTAVSRCHCTHHHHHHHRHQPKQCANEMLSYIFILHFTH